MKLYRGKINLHHLPDRIIVEFVTYNDRVIHQLRVDKYFWEDEHNDKFKALQNAWNFCSENNSPKIFTPETNVSIAKLIDLISHLFQC